MLRRIASVGLVCGVLLVGLRTSADQTLTGVRATWQDLETWTRDIAASEQELGLGLHPPGGAVVAFLGRVATRDQIAAPAEVRLQIAAANMANPTVLRTRTLVFVADAGTDEEARFDLGSRLSTDDGSPGGIIENGVGVMPAADFVRLVDAETLTASILGFEVTFRQDQLAAMRDFAERLGLD
jgi:hypothetical protein